MVQDTSCDILDSEDLCLLTDCIRNELLMKYLPILRAKLCNEVREDAT